VYDNQIDLNGTMENLPSLSIMIRHIISILLMLLLSGCVTQDSLKDFTSDGCSLFPDRNLITEQDWCECCFEHDVLYWQGGTEKERLLADKELNKCVFEKTNDKLLAETIYQGVRFGGSPYFYNWYRWGYGWSYERKYKPLTDDEKNIVKRKLEKYSANNKTSICQK
jgi:hypothetical protein